MKIIREGFGRHLKWFVKTHCIASLYVFLAIICISTTAWSQNYRGVWKGEIQQADSVIKVRFNVMKQEASSVYAMMLDPAFDMFCDSTTCSDTLHLKSSKYDIEYKALPTANLNRLTGRFIMNGRNYDLDVFRGDTPVYRPQLPQKPYPYTAEDVWFENMEDSVTLAGTLTLPETPDNCPAVILISGSSPNDRDYENYHHRPFLVLADYLTRKGIAVLRYDDRGVNQSTGEFYKSTPLNFAKDIDAAIGYLKAREGIDGNRIGLIGHSGGGLVAAIAGSRNPAVNFIALLAAPGLPLKDINMEQKKSLFKQGEISGEGYALISAFQKDAYRLIEESIPSISAIDSLKEFQNRFVGYFKKEGIPNPLMSPEYLYWEMLRITLSGYNRFCVACDPADYIGKIACPVISLNGSNDWQVPAKTNQEAIKMALQRGRNKNYRIMELEGLNHSFQECTTGSVKESANIEQTFSPKAMQIIAEWIEWIN